MKDGLILMYVKNNIVYPVALTKEQQETFEIIQCTLPQPVMVIADKPIGEAIDLLKKIYTE